ncbi:MAG: hypothetical protein ABFD92_09430 [Planctomycetaceae bacterium]|nr:hypothetical protein [Planctomycetaceae bacterium]
MNRHVCKTVSAWAALAMLIACGGCTNFRDMMLYSFAKAPIKTVPAEFDKFSGKRVAVVIFADQAVQYEYPMARLELATVVAQEIRAKLTKANVVDPRIILEQQDSDIHWDSMEKTRFGKLFGADYVLYVALVDFSTREVGSLELVRGRIVADVALYSTEQEESKSCQWRNPNLRIEFPGGNDAKVRLSENDIRYQTEKVFADTLVKKFYTHKVEME